MDEYATTAAPQAMSRPTVAGQLDSLHTKASRLADLADKLRERLSPILQQSAEVAGPRVVGVSAPDASSLRGAADAVHAVLDRLEETLEDIGNRAEV